MAAASRSSEMIKAMDMKLRLNNKGFTLIEVLIAVVVLAVGLLGFAALQLTATSNAQEAQSRTVAVALADSLVAKIRSNYAYVSTFPAPANDNVYWPNNNYIQYCRVDSAPATYLAATNCNANNCTGDQVAAYDHQLICEELANSALQGGEIGLRCVDNANAVLVGDGDICSPGSHVSVYVSWSIATRQDRGEQVYNSNSGVGDCANIMGLADSQTNRCLQLEIVL